MEWFYLIIPMFLSILGLIFYRHKLNTIELVAPTLVGIILILIMKTVMINGLTSDKEFLTSYPIEVRYYEKWDEYIHKTCTRTVSCGKGCTTTVTYDCSYVDRHPKKWRMKMNTGDIISISEKYYNFLAKKWGSERIFVDMHRDYHSYDGDMYKYKWKAKFTDIDPYTVSHSYENKVQAVNSVMKFRNLDSIERIGLYEYPKIKNFTQKSCINCSDEDNLLLSRLNAYLGFKYEVKMFVIVFENKGIEIAERQQHIWKGGNKNELVVCVDKDNKWAKTFSWCDDKSIEVELNDIFTNSELSLNQKLKLMEHEVESKWKRKHFSDFDYIKVPLTRNNHIAIFIVVFLVSLGIIIYGIKNEFDAI